MQYFNCTCVNHNFLCLQMLFSYNEAVEKTEIVWDNIIQY